MAKIQIGKGRSQIENTFEGLRITIPSKKNYFLIFFIGFWLIGWGFGEVTVLFQIFRPEMGAVKLFMLAWLGAWTVGGAFAIYVWLWNVNGKEIINVSSTEFQILRTVAGLARSKEYDVASIANLRSQLQTRSMFGSANGMEFCGISGGSIAFDYGHSTHRFGAKLDEAEAQHIVSTIKNKFPRL
ncbi:MAG: hypothetical protein KAS96_02525 [Planctomycetes bacterium]|nr:hypothetical protein [Planctomycetota bacterium]